MSMNKHNRPLHYNISASTGNHSPVYEILHDNSSIRMKLKIDYIYVINDKENYLGTI